MIDFDRGVRTTEAIDEHIRRENRKSNIRAIGWIVLFVLIVVGTFRGCQHLGIPTGLFYTTGQTVPSQDIKAFALRCRELGGSSSRDWLGGTWCRTPPHCDPEDRLCERIIVDVARWPQEWQLRH